MAEEQRAAAIGPSKNDVPVSPPEPKSLEGLLAEDDISEAQLALLEGTRIATAQLAAEIGRHAELWQKTHKPVELPRLRDQDRGKDRQNATRGMERIPPRLVRPDPKTDQPPQARKTPAPVEPTLTKSVSPPADTPGTEPVAVEPAEKLPPAPSSPDQQTYWPVNAPDDLDRHADGNIADGARPPKRRRSLYLVVTVLAVGMIVMPASWQALVRDRTASPSSDTAKTVTIDVPATTVPTREIASKDAALSPPPPSKTPLQPATSASAAPADVPAPQDVPPKPILTAPTEEIAIAAPETKVLPAPKVVPPKKVTLISAPEKPVLTPSADAMRAKPFEPSSSSPGTPQPFVPSGAALPKSTPAATSNSWLKAQPFQPSSQ